MQPAPPADPDDRRRRLLLIASAVVAGLVVITAFAVLALGGDKKSPTSLEAGPTTSVDASSTSTSVLAPTTTVEPVNTTIPPTSLGTTTAPSPVQAGGCTPLGDTHPILFVRKSEHGPPWYIWRYDPATCASSQVSRDNGNPNVLNWGESWSPTRDRIAFVRDGAGLMVMNADGTHERMLLAAQSATTQSSGAWTAWSPDGKRIASAGRTDGLWVVDLATGRATNIVNDGNVRAVSWSPDGSAIAFDVGGRITSVKPDGTGRKDIGPGADADWGPDGRIAFTSLSGGGVAVMNGDGTGVKKVVMDSTAGGPAWSPDGKLLVYSSVSGGITVINADGSGTRLLVPDGDHNTQPTW